ncbi:MAG TPA: DUF2442 domain-containing protein [bacterium]|nr:DUF2442 domain-containing protein [bacterium]
MHKIKEVKVLSEYILIITFMDGTKKKYDCSRLFKENPVFNKLKNKAIFKNVSVDPGGYGISWDSETDLSEFEVWEKGTDYSG